MNTVYINDKHVGQCTYAQIRPTVGSKSVPENYDIELIEFVSVQPQLIENQIINSNNNLLKINDLAFDLQHGTALTNEQWEKVEKIYKLSLMGDEEEEL